MRTFELPTTDDPARCDRRKRFVKRLVSAGALAVASAVKADPPEHLTLEDIVVTATAIKEPSATVVGAKTIEKGRNLSVPDAIKDEPGIMLQRRAAVGDTADNVAIRGLSANRLMLNINGRPVNGAGVVGGHYVDWSTIPLDSIERIELIRGGSYVRYGNNALGGVINVITESPTEEPEFALYSNFAAGSGIDRIWNHRLTHSYKIGPLGYCLSGSIQEADEFLWNNDFEGRNLSLALDLDVPWEAAFSLGLQYANARRGFIRQNRRSSNPNDPGFYQTWDDEYPLAFGETLNPYSGTAFIPGPGAWWDKDKYYFDIGYQQALGDATVDVKVYANHEDRDEKNYSAAGTVPGYGDGALVLDRTVESDRSYGGRLEYVKPLGDHELLLGLDHQVLAYGDVDLHYIDAAYNSHNWFGPPATGYEASSKGTTWGYYAQDRWGITDRLLITGGLRYDRYHNESINGSAVPDLREDELSPKLTGTYELTDADTVTVAVYQAVRTPGLPETYWWASGATGGHPELSPEKNSAAEIVLQHEWADRGMLRLSAYYYDIRDYIMFRFDPTWRGVYNIDRAILTGASVDGRVRLGPLVSARGSVCFQQSSKRGDAFDAAGLSDEIDYLPEWKASAGLDVSLPLEAMLSVDVRYVGDRQAIYAYQVWPGQAFALEDLDAYATLDVCLRMPVAAHGEASVYVENVCDKTYEERFGYPLPGRTAGVSLKLTF